MCLADGHITPATIVDHIDPVRGDWNAFLTGPLQSLCEHHHNSDKRYIDLHGHPRIQFGVDGWPIEEGDPVGAKS
jgi:hypothetical protein